MRTPEQRYLIIARLGPTIARELSTRSETWTFRHTRTGEGQWHRLDDGMTLRVTAGWTAFADRLEVAPITLPVGSDLAAPARLRIHVTIRHTHNNTAAEIRERLILPLSPYFLRQRAVMRASRYAPSTRAAARAFIEDVFGAAIPAGTDGIAVTIGGTVLPLRAELDGQVTLGRKRVAPHDLAVMANRLQTGSRATVS